MTQPYPPHQDRAYGHGQRSYAPQPQQYPSPQGYGPPPKRRRIWPWVIGGLIALLVLPLVGFVACTAAVGGAIDAASGPTSMTYVLEGDGKATTVTYVKDVNGGQQQTANVDLPWQQRIDFAEAFMAPAVLTAQRGAGDGTLTCKILDAATGAELTTSSSSGPYTVVTCSSTGATSTSG